MSRLLKRAERWVFAPGSAGRLATLRIGLCSLLALRLSRGIYADLSAQPPSFFRPVSFMHLFSSMPSRGTALAIQLIGVTAALMAAIGLRARITLPAAWLSAAFLNGMATSVGKVVHNDVLLLLALVPLLAAPVSDTWALDPARRNPSSTDISARYGWPVRVAMVVVAGGYFFTGLAKLIFSGPAWFSSDNLRWILYAASDGRMTPNHLALFIADRPWIAHIVAFATLVVEIGAPVVLWKPRAARLFVPGVVLLHASIWATMGLYYSAWAITAAVVFVDWPSLAGRVRAWAPMTARRTLVP